MTGPFDIENVGLVHKEKRNGHKGYSNNGEMGWQGQAWLYGLTARKNWIKLGLLFVATLSFLTYLYSSTSSAMTDRRKSSGQAETHAHVPSYGKQVNGSSIWKVLDSPAVPPFSHRFTVPYSAAMFNIGTDRALRTIGSNAQVEGLDPSEVEGWDVEGTWNAVPFNPSLLRMPTGSKWQYVVSTRARRSRDDVVGADDVLGQSLLEKQGFLVEEKIVVMGANATADGRIVFVTKPKPLDIPAVTRFTCDYSPSVFGPEDARLLWSDHATPMMTFTRTSVSGANCRSMAVVPDLRAYWPELRSALVDIPASVPSSDSFTGANMENALAEVHWERHQDHLEKNWMPFFPGAKANRKTSLPNFHHSLSSGRILLPTLHGSVAGQQHDTSQIPYRSASLSSLKSRFCSRTAHPHLENFHHATPLYRMTLCPRRACEPDSNNTVLVAMSHVLAWREEARFYGRYVSLWNVTEPFEQIAIGPLARLPTQAGIQFSMSLAFSPKVQVDSEFDNGLSPSHGFLDDDVWLSYGIEDSKLAFVKTAASELLVGLRPCSSE